ncbi:LamG-like jellyroll fold domain-containing protein, partial [Bdellovibrionota bacterium FG-2]
GSFQHVVAVVNGSSLNIYRNGSNVYSTSMGVSIASTATALVIGREGPSYASYFNGSMAAVRIYNRNLGQSEVSQNCFALAGRFDGVTCH